MNIETAYKRRETLSHNELERLRAALLDQIERYARVSKYYPPERMKKYAEPHMAKLKGRLAEVERLLSN